MLILDPHAIDGTHWEHKQSDLSEMSVEIKLWL